LVPTGTPAADALGTNKAVAIVGTSGAAVTYARRAPVDVRLAVRIGIAAVAGSSAGAFLAAGMSTDVLKPLIMVVLLGVAAFVLRPAFGTAPRRPGLPPAFGQSTFQGVVANVSWGRTDKAYAKKLAEAVVEALEHGGQCSRPVTSHQWRCACGRSPWICLRVRGTGPYWTMSGSGRSCY
jgi:hypothetical protein